MLYIFFFLKNFEDGRSFFKLILRKAIFRIFDDYWVNYI